jgi:hypothetical protein
MTGWAERSAFRPLHARLGFRAIAAGGAGMRNRPAFRSSAGSGRFWRLHTVLGPGLALCEAVQQGGAALGVSRAEAAGWVI